jgi:hypothetical protein
MANNNDAQERLNRALRELDAGGQIRLDKDGAVRKVQGKLVIFNPQVIQPVQFVGSKEKLATAIASGKVSVITTAQLSAALNPVPVVPKPANSAKPKPKLNGTADDDTGKKNKPAAKTPSDNIKVRKDADPNLSPGKRLKNPLGALSSYNYQLSLYMLTPDALEIFKSNGYRDINKLGVVFSNAIGPNLSNNAISAGAYIIAQSGGVNTSLGNETRAPSFSFDYGIDNLTYEIVGPKDSGTAAAEYKFEFTITEPYGFSFITNLKRASDAIMDYEKRRAKKPSAVAKNKSASEDQRANPNQNQPNSQPNDNSAGKGPIVSGPQNPSKQIFVLGIRFYGYDDSGQPVRGTTPIMSTDSNGVMTGKMQEIDPGNNSFALFERYYPIIITTMTSTVDGRETKYRITAEHNGMSALGTKTGQINGKGFEISASTVGEALDKLVSNLNKEQKSMNEGLESGYTYSIKYASKYDYDRIRNANIVSEADLDKYKWPGSGATKTSESNPNTEVNKNNKPKNNARTIKIGNQPIIQAINQIIAQSSFLEDAMRTVFTTAIEPDQEKAAIPKLDKPGKKTIEWFHLTPEIGNLKWDENKADWVYDIVYTLNVYDTPVIDTAYTNPGKKYYGPVKRYEYWYSGTNTEVRSYKQELKNNWYTTFLDGDFNRNAKEANSNGGQNTPNASGGSGNNAGTNTSLVQNQKTGQPTQGKAGLAMEAQNGYLTSLFDPSAQAQAEVEILGDPDWLMSSNSTGFGGNESLVYNKFYGSAPGSISPAGGQVFFEIDFKEAVDYKSDGQDMAGVSGAPGTLSVNSSILFWKDPKSISKLVKGISYSLNTCKNTFSGGLFTQRLFGVMNTFGDSASNDDGAAREAPVSPNNSGPNQSNSNATTSANGLKPAPKGGRTGGKGNPGSAEAARIAISQKNSPIASERQRWVRGGSNSGAAAELRRTTNNSPPET